MCRAARHLPTRMRARFSAVFFIARGLLLAAATRSAHFFRAALTYLPFLSNARIKFFCAQHDTRFLDSFLFLFHFSHRALTTFRVTSPCFFILLLLPWLSLFGSCPGGSGAVSYGKSVQCPAWAFPLHHWLLTEAAGATTAADTGTSATPRPVRFVFLSPSPPRCVHSHPFPLLFWRHLACRILRFYLRAPILHFRTTTIFSSHRACSKRTFDDEVFS